MTFRFLGLTLLLGGAALWLSRSPEPSTKHFRQPKLPVYFIENQGQVDSSVSYYVHGSRSAAYFTSTSIFYALRSSSRQAGVQLEFLGANPNPAVEAASPTAAVVSYFHGSREQWKTGLPTYSRITYRDLWPGIDLEFAGPEGYLKYTFHVRPGADARLIRLAYRGATSITLTASGSLQIETPAGAFSDDKPIAWQDTSRGRQSVTAAFQLDGEQVRFQLGDFDPSLPLIIDPVVVLYAGYFGGSAAEEGDGIAVDAAGNAYITGATVSAESTLPVVGGPDVTANGNADAFVAKINASGTALLYAGYLGGGSWDYSRSIAVDAAGSAYIAGHTDSNELSFPVTVGPDLTHNGDTDAFVAKVNPTGTALLYAGYVGGATDDFGYGIAVDAAGNAYVTGETASTQATFPAIGGPDLTHNGDMDAFVAKVNASGTALVYSGYIGGSVYDSSQRIAVDHSGSAYITGVTLSTEATFPVTTGPDLTHNGSADAFVAKVNASGTALVYAGYIGGLLDDFGVGIVVDPAGSAYVTGFTFSTQATFPVVAGPDLSHNGGADAFAVKVNATGTALIYSGFIGGSAHDYGYAIALDPAGNTYITGETYSTQPAFPATTGPDPTHNGFGDAFVAKVNASGTALVYAGFLGGVGLETGDGIAVDAAGNAYITGTTYSNQSTFPVTSGPDLTYNGNDDAYVAKISAFPSTTGPVLVFRNAFNAIETNTFPSPALRNSGGNFRLSPALALSPSGRAFMAGRDASAGVWINVLNPDETYQGWQFAGGNSPGQPALAVAGETAWIAVRDQWNSYSVRTYNSVTGFGPWTWLQGILATDPQIAACANSDVYITGKDNWNGVWTRRYSASLAAWQSWRFIGGIITGTPAITCGWDNAAYIAVRDPSNNMWLARAFQETQVAWNYGEGIFQGDLQVAANGALIHVFGLSSGVPWFRSWAVFGGWGGWSSADGVLTHFAPAIYGGQVFIAGQDPGGNLWWWTSLGNSWTNLGNKNVAPGSGFSAGAR